MQSDNNLYSLPCTTQTVHCTHRHTQALGANTHIKHDKSSLMGSVCFHTHHQVCEWLGISVFELCVHLFFRGLILLHLHFKKKNNKCNNPATHKDSQPCTWVSMLYPVTQTCTQHYCSADAVEFHPMPASSLFTELGVALRLAGW